MKIRITESQYNILVNKPMDVVFGNINEVRGKILSPEEEDEKIKEILDYVRSGGKFNLHKNYRWLYGRKSYYKNEKFQKVFDQINQIQEELENKKIQEILDYVRNGGEFIRNYKKDENYAWLINTLGNTKKEKLYNVLDQITQIQEEFENKRIEEILDYVRNGGKFTRIYEKDEKYAWLKRKSIRDKTGKFQKVLDQIIEIQTELGIKKEWWGEKTIKDILEEMKFNGVTPRHKYKECKNSLTCKQYEFDIYLPYNENNVKINKNIPENGIIFEYDGIQHFEFKPYFHKTEEKFNSQIFRDKEKNLYCKNNNIKLVRIPYTSKTEKDITRDIEFALKDTNTFILTGDYPKAGWNK